MALAGAVAATVSVLAWISWQRFERMSRDLDKTQQTLRAANDHVSRLEASFASASVLHDLWGLGSRFADASAGVCAVGEEQNKIRTATALAVEMWSDSDVRSEVNLERSLLPVLRGLEQRNVHVAGVSLPAGVVAQYRRFRRDALGDVIMLDPSRIDDSQGRAAVLELLRRAGEGQLDPEKTTLVYRLDEYGKISYPLVQGPGDASLIHASLSSDPRASAVTIAATDYPCS